MKNAVQFIAIFLSVFFYGSSLQANTESLCAELNFSPGSKVLHYSKKHGGTTGKRFFLAPSKNRRTGALSDVRRIKKISIQHHRRVENIQVTLVNKTGKQAVKAAGGNQGKWSHIYLDNDEYIIRVTGRSGSLIDQITFYTNKRRKFGPYGGNGGTPFSITAPRNSRVVGFYGNYDKAIYQIGLVYFSVKPFGLSNSNAKKMPINSKFHIVSKVNNLNLDVKGGSKKSGTNIWMYKPNSSAAQQWTFVSAGEGYYRIKSAVSGLYLQVAGGGKKSGASIIQATRNRSSAQLWKAISAGGDYFYLQSKASGLYLDVRGGGKASKTPVWQHPLNKTNAQKWRLQKVKVKSKKRSKSNDYEIDMERACG